ncbi:hypothetical protein ABBQ32_007889 [Trebouxia sp. C0010 RCD-2024]
MAQVGCYTADSSREVARTVTQLGSLLRSRGNLTVGSSPGSGTSSFACLQLEGYQGPKEAGTCYNIE